MLTCFRTLVFKNLHVPRKPGLRQMLWTWNGSLLIDQDWIKINSHVLMTTCSFDLNAAATFSSTSNHLQKMTQEEHSKNIWRNSGAGSFSFQSMCAWDYATCSSNNLSSNSGPWILKLCQIIHRWITSVWWTTYSGASNASIDETVHHWV